MGDQDHGQEGGHRQGKADEEIPQKPPVEGPLIGHEQVHRLDHLQQQVRQLLLRPLVDEAQLAAQEAYGQQDQQAQHGFQYGQDHRYSNLSSGCTPSVKPPPPSVNKTLHEYPSDFTMGSK